MMLDVCCGSKMFWANKNDRRVIFGDIRKESITVSDQSNGKIGGTRSIHIEPDTLLDFRNLPFADNQFKLVSFDPPHLIKAGKKSWLAAKYGTLSENWKEDIAKGFSECFRVLENEGILIFKWNESQVKVSEVLSLTKEKPLMGHLSGRKGLTHWIVFSKQISRLTDVVSTTSCDTTER